MEADKPQKCQWCGKEKTPLPETTSKQGLTVFVCTKAVGKNKVSCDGDVYKMATKKTP